MQTREEPLCMSSTTSSYNVRHVTVFDKYIYEMLPTNYTTYRLSWAFIDRLSWTIEKP